MPFSLNLLASAGNPIEHIAYRPWETAPVVWGAPIFGSHIAAMFIAGLLAMALVLAAARRRAIQPVGRGYNLVESMVLFVRDFIAKPALHGQAYRFLPFLLTLFVFLLACNLLGMLPLFDICRAIPAMAAYPIGGTPTGNIWMTGALAVMTLLAIIGFGISTQVKAFVHKGRSPVVGWLLAVPLYLWGLMPPMNGPIKYLMAPLMIPLELMGLLFKCFALAIRLFANMSAGHILLAVLLSFIAMAPAWISWLVTPASVLGGVAISMLELLVAVIQAFIFTFLAAMFIGMAVNPHH